MIKNQAVDNITIIIEGVHPYFIGVIVRVYSANGYSKISFRICNGSIPDIICTYERKASRHRNLIVFWERIPTVTSPHKV